MRNHTPLPTVRSRFLLGGLTACLVAVVGAGATRAQAGKGEQVYKQMCASCHGEAGEGTKTYPHPLVGERSLEKLTKLIDRTMPEDAPEKCVGEDAAAVAAYVYDTFYSAAAQERNRPKLEFARLTVRQYRNAVTDLVGSFRPVGQWGDERGLRGDYARSRRSRGNAALSRLDATVDFDFGTGSPDNKLDAKEFSGRWQGSVLVPETGDYEFIVRTDNAARLWVNDLTRPLIDAGVKSGPDTEFRGSLRLLGGRVYPLRLEFFKSDKEKKASIRLLWKPPHLAEEVIPARNLTPSRFPEVFVATTPFPPDDRSFGYERGTSVSEGWVNAVTEGALETAAYVATRLPELSGVSDKAGDRVPRLKEFCRRFAERAFRRPLTPEQQAAVIDRAFAEARDPELAVKRVVLLVLSSPRFLYREAPADRDPHAVAARLAFSLWDSLPDQPLLDAARAGQLATREQVARQAERMLPDLRTKAKLRDFLLQWLKVEEAADLSKDRKGFPGFDSAVATDLRTSLDLFLEDVVWGDNPDFRRLLTADEVYLNGRLAKFYGADLPSDAPFQKVSLREQRRAGVLTHPYLMATFAYTETTSPIHRGVFVMRGLLGLPLRPPPVAAAPLAPDLHPNLTTRERIALQTSPAACMSCHATINPLGYPLENFDPVGRFRDREKGKPIDATGSFETRDGETVPFAGVQDLAKYLAASDQAQGAFVQQVFQHLTRQSARSYGVNTLSELRESFANSGYNVRKLVVEIAAASALPAGR